MVGEAGLRIDADADAEAGRAKEDGEVIYTGWDHYLKEQRLGRLVSQTRPLAGEDQCHFG